MDPGRLVTVENLDVGEELNHLYRYLVARRCITPLDNVNTSHLHIYSRDALKKIRSGDASWEGMVQPAVADLIKSRGLFGYQ